MSGSSPRRTGTFRRWWRRGSCARISTTASGSSTSSCLRCGIVARTSPCWSAISWRPRRSSGIEPDAVRALMSYPWPGNVRELQNAIENAFVTAAGARIGLNHLPSELRRGPAVEKVLNPQQDGGTAAVDRCAEDVGREPDESRRASGHQPGHGLEADAAVRRSVRLITEQVNTAPLDTPVPATVRSTSKKRQPVEFQRERTKESPAASCGMALALLQACLPMLLKECPPE